MFFSSSFMVSSLTFKSLIYFELIFVYGMLVVQFHSFSCDCPIFSTPSHYSKILKIRYTTIFHIILSFKCHSLFKYALKLLKIGKFFILYQKKLNPQQIFNTTLEQKF